MSPKMELVNIREFRLGDEPALHAVFHSAVHDTASADYSAEQIDAWAPASMDRDSWAMRMRKIRPFVVEQEARIVGYADLQPSGYIDHFYVCGQHARRGVGTMLMNHIFRAANAQGLKALTSDVSRTAQPFFQRFGFMVIEQKLSFVRGIVVPNAFMRKELTDL